MYVFVYVYTYTQLHESYQFSFFSIPSLEFESCWYQVLLDIIVLSISQQMNHSRCLNRTTNVHSLSPTPQDANLVL